MAVIDLMNIVDQRLGDITKQNPSMTAKELYFEGEDGLWCLISIVGGGGRAIEYDFIESDNSWKRADAVSDYAQAALGQVKVLVIVPDQVLVDVLFMVRDYDAQGVSVSDHSAMDLIPLPLTY
jgi:hypothetical protein